ncbi:MAG: MarR family winged helix-turn-helix transcriptional regulator [Jatrophihabitans sp.]|uniref:MarR family winged helix-turn-helix transcriptional regulator n=1 Tax=Jatrophihabitans sp. TaxID=1932789 RepID=UPI003F80E1F8
MPTPDRDPAAAVIALLQELFDRARRFQTRQARAVHPRLDQPLYSLLLDIGRRQPVRASDLVASRQVDKALVSRQVAALDRLGLITRRVDPADSRAWLLEVSGPGEQAMQDMLTRRRRFAASLLHDLSADDRQTVEDGLVLLHRVLDRLDQPDRQD